jgi:hypothetical protein
VYEIYVWIQDILEVEEDVQIIQIDRIKRQVYVKFYTAHKVNELLNRTNGCTYYEHTNGMISQVHIYPAVLGLHTV